MNNYYPITLICIDDRVDLLGFGSGGKELTFGKKYSIRWAQTVDNGRTYVSIINDLGKESEYLLSRFVDESDYRDIKIDQLLDR